MSLPHALPRLGAKVPSGDIFLCHCFFLTDFLLVMIPLQLSDRQCESSCWNPGIFHQNWTCIQPTITWTVLSSQPVTAPVTAAACSLFHKKRRLKTSSFQGNSFHSHFSSCSLWLRTCPSPFLWALGMDGNGQDRQMEPLVRPGVGISWNCLSKDNIIKTEELKSLWECFSSSFLLQDRAGQNTLVLAPRSSV